MRNKKLSLGMLVMVLAFGMSVVGCDNPTGNNNNVTPITPDNEFLFRNQSNHTIVVAELWSVGVGIRPYSFVLTPGSEQLARGEISFFSFMWAWYRQDTENQTGVTISSEWENVRTITFRNS